MKVLRTLGASAAALCLLFLAPIDSAQAGKPAPTENHGQCVSNSPKPEGGPGRSEVAKDKAACQEQATRLVCMEAEDRGDTVQLNSLEDRVTVAGSGSPSAGSNLNCRTNISVTAGDTASFTYELGANTDPCGGGVPRMYYLIGGMYYNTIDGDPQCSQAQGNTVTYNFPVTGTVTEVGFVYDRQDFGSVTYSGAVVDGVTLNI